MPDDAITPYGGRLVQRVASRISRAGYENQLRQEPLARLRMEEQTAADLQMIAVGAYSPLRGFMNRETYNSVLNDMHLPSGLPWTIPIMLPAGEDFARRRHHGETVVLEDVSGTTLGIVVVEEVFPYDAENEAAAVYQTTSSRHPGVRQLYERAGRKPWYLAGEVTLLRRRNTDFPEACLEPAQSREIFRQKGWQSITAFQTRNPIHRAHEYLQKCALEVMDGLFLHPLVGETKEDDVPARIRMKSYRVLLDRYYPKDRVVLAVFPAAMRYAGPREAVFHAIVRRNYGCTHLIVGRDHAGVGDFYGTYDSQKIFDSFDSGLLGIKPLCFEHAFYCKRCGQMVTTRTCPHSSADHVVLSGTRVREMLRRGETPPPEYSRPEVAQLLADALKERTGDTVAASIDGC